MTDTTKAAEQQAREMAAKLRGVGRFVQGLRGAAPAVRDAAVGTIDVSAAMLGVMDEERAALIAERDSLAAQVAQLVMAEAEAMALVLSHEGMIAKLREALGELVSLKRLKGDIERWVADDATGHQWPQMQPYERRMAACADYERRKQPAWSAAFAIVDPAPAPQEPTQAPAQPEQSEAGPVAVIGPVWHLLWASADAIAVIAARHGLSVGDLLYAPSAIAAARQEAAEEMRERCAQTARRFEPDERTSYVTYASDAIRALKA